MRPLRSLELREDWRVTLNLVPLVLKSISGGGSELEVFGNDYPTLDGTAIRDYVHVLNLAEAHIKAFEYLEAGGTTMAVNLGTGVSASVLEVVATAEKVTGGSIPYRLVPRRAGDPVALYSDIRGAKELLNWEARLGLTDIVSSAWAWHSAHPSGYED